MAWNYGLTLKLHMPRITREENNVSVIRISLLFIKTLADCWCDVMQAIGPFGSLPSMHRILAIVAWNVKPGGLKRWRFCSDAMTMILYSYWQMRTQNQEIMMERQCKSVDSQPLRTHLHFVRCCNPMACTCQLQVKPTEAQMALGLIAMDLVSIA